MVIFTTAYSEYAVEGFNLNAIDYSLKPFTFDRFQQALIKAKAYHEYIKKNEEEKCYIFVRADYNLHKISLEEILFIEGLDDYLKINFADKKPIVARLTLKNLMDKLPNNEFLRVHRSFIVPISRIEKLNNRMFIIGNEEIPIGVSYEEQVKT